jgi:glycosyltransferase involved in cell wall biosynthesis
MKVLMLRDSFPNGGAERQLALLAASLPEGMDVRIWGMGSGPFVPVLHELGLPVELSERRGRFDPSPVAGLWRLVRVWRPDVLHTWGWMSAAAALPVAAACRVPVVDGTIRNATVDARFVVPRRAAMRAARLVVANSRAGLQAWGVGGARGRVVYNGFDPGRLARLEASGDPAAVAGPRPFTAVMTGRMKPAKDFTSLIAAARLLTAEGDGDWRFVLVGGGEDRPKLERQAATLVRSGVLSFVDAGLEVLDHVQGADAGVLLTNARVHAEGCSNSLLEYMACSLPVVCTDSGGNREVVEHGQSGYIVPPGDPQAVAKSLRRLRDDAELRRRLGARGRARLQSEFTVPRMVALWAGIYEEAAGQGRRSTGPQGGAWGS